jgi:hypothetical protein
LSFTIRRIRTDNLLSRSWGSTGPSLLRNAIGLGAGELSALYDQIFASDRTSFKPAFENLSRPYRIASISLIDSEAAFFQVSNDRITFANLRTRCVY